MLSWFYSDINASNPNTAQTTNFNINGLDISNNYIGIGTNSKISVSQVYKNIDYFSNGVSIGNLFELNLAVFSGTINVHYKIWPTSLHDGLLIQFLQNTSITFNYRINGTFVAVGTGGKGGNSQNSNAGGGGGGGGVVTGSIVDAQPGTFYFYFDVIDQYNTNVLAGYHTQISFNGFTIQAFGGSDGGPGKGNGVWSVNSSTGGGGSYSNNGTSPGVISNDASFYSNRGVFINNAAFFYIGTPGKEQNNDTGAGGGGGGAGGEGILPANNDFPGIGGTGKTVTFGQTSITLGGGGGGGARSTGSLSAQIGGSGGNGGGGNGGGRNWDGSLTSNNGLSGFPNTGGGGGGAANQGGTGGNGGSGTVFLYILPNQVSI